MKPDATIHHRNETTTTDDENNIDDTNTQRVLVWKASKNIVDWEPGQRTAASTAR